MPDNVTALVVPIFIVLAAEIGDKSLLITMGFSTKYGARKVIAGVFGAAVVLNALAVAAGSLITRFQPLRDAIQGVAVFSFILFGLWTLIGNGGSDTRENSKNLLGSVMTIAITFFIAELGDKTQLTVLALAAHFPQRPLWVFTGATIGLISANVAGIVFGAAIGKRFPERMVRIFSASVFIFFGLVGICQLLAEKGWLH